MNQNTQHVVKPCAVFITALGLEFTAVEHYLTETREEQHSKGTVYRVGTFSGALEWQVAIVQAGMHNVPAAVETERAVAHFKPLVAIFVGVAGGLKDVSLGDVVAATKIYSYEAGKDEGNFKPRPESSESDYGLVQRAQAVARDGEWHKRIVGGASVSPPRAFVGAMAAGEKVVGSISSATYKMLRHHYGDALAAEMEGYGFLRTAYMNREVQALAVRGISDLVEGERGGRPFRITASSSLSCRCIRIRGTG